MDSALSSEEIEHLAKLTHTVNKALCEASGDDSQVSWDEAPDWQKESAIEGVIANANFTVQSGGRPLPPEDNHDKWMSKKLRDGWRYGPVKDAENKVHPCLLPWNELPRADRLKDILFGGIVHFYSVFRDETDAP